MQALTSLKETFSSRVLRAIFVILLVAIAGCSVDNDRTNPYDPDYDGPTGTITGRAVIEGGSAFAFVGPTGGQVRLNHSGIRVTISEINWHNTTTDIFGTYSLAGVPVGTWTLTFSLTGYESRVVSNVTVSAGSQATVETVGLSEIVNGKLLFSSSNTATGFEDIVMIDDDGDSRFQFSFQEAEVESGDQLSGTNWIGLYLWGIFGSFTWNYDNEGIYLLDITSGTFFPLLLRADWKMTGIQEGAIGSIKWGPARPAEPAYAQRSLTVTGGTGAAALGVTGLTATETPNQGLYFTYVDFLGTSPEGSDMYVGGLGIYNPMSIYEPPRLPATLVSTVGEPYSLVDGDTLTMSVDGGGDQTVTFWAADFASFGSDISVATAAEVAYVINFYSDLGSMGYAAKDDGNGKLVLAPIPPIERMTGLDADDMVEENPVFFDDGTKQRLFYTRIYENPGTGVKSNYIQNRDPFDDLSGSSIVSLNMTGVSQLLYADLDIDGDFTDGIPDIFKMIAIRNYMYNVCTGDMVQNFAGVDFSEISLDIDGNPLYLGSLTCSTTYPGLLFGSVPDSVTIDFDRFQSELARMEKVHSLSVLPFSWIEDEGGANEREVTAIVHADRRASVPEAHFFEYRIINDGGTFCNDFDFDGCGAGLNQPFTYDEVTDSLFRITTFALWDVPRLELSAIWYTFIDITGVTTPPYIWEADMLINPSTGSWELLASEENKFITDLGFSPDGDRLVYTHGTRSEASWDIFNSDIFTYDPETGVKKRLTWDESNNQKPIWFAEW